MDLCFKLPKGSWHQQDSQLLPCQGTHAGGSRHPPEARTGLSGAQPSLSFLPLILPSGSGTASSLPHMAAPEGSLVLKEDSELSQHLTNTKPKRVPPGWPICFTEENHQRCSHTKRQSKTQNLAVSQVISLSSLQICKCTSSLGQKLSTEDEN